jgi:tRNA(Ile)-lysidine synthase
MAEVIREWCLEHRLEPPPGQQLDEFVSQIQEAPSDRQPVLEWGKTRVQRHGDALWLVKQPSGRIEWAVDWEGEETLLLPADCGSLSFSKPLSGPLAKRRMRVCSGQPGEKLRIHNGFGHHAVKKLLAEAGVPPWYRAHWPRLWLDGELVAVGDRWLDVEFKEQLTREGLNLRWTSNLNISIS